MPGGEAFSYAVLVFEPAFACASLAHALAVRRGAARRPASEYSHEFFVLPVHMDTTFYSFENARPYAMIAALVIETHV